MAALAAKPVTVERLDRRSTWSDPDDASGQDVSGLNRMPLSQIVTACQRETSRLLRGEPHTDAFGFELFRRALAQRDQAAWEAVLIQYRGMVMSWVLRHPAAASAQTDAEDLVIRAFERLWRAVGSERLRQFPRLGALLLYLKMCVHSVLLDDVTRSAPPVEVRQLDDALELADEHEATEEIVLDRQEASELWRSVMAALHDDAERVVVYLSFALGLTPARIFEKRPDQFVGVADVYRIKRNAIDHLRRSQALRAFTQAA